ncbi:hypothetical protein [Sphingomonas turrisvirgatae]|uniref:Uncharacterized protein n=1 Tax=Sphingomonas turrisvirgatae TaxID=1888892 RepID=A0A1E3LR14_9SPHN|nr:hypothetical protein [Sphingomonas turrisvirgatae]ODP36198.1 hypothetical protein BFL28_07255 [Sphingomonas turrisvirgatae]
MTIRTSDEIRDDLAVQGKALAQANADAALHERLIAAKAEATRLRKVCDGLTAELSQAQAAEAKAVIAKFEAGNRNFRVERVQHDQRKGIAHDRFVITWERLCYDMNAHDSVWQDQTIDGFAVLPDDVMQYILRHKPQVIPADILALAPDDPFEAMGRYLTGKARGYFKA